jgi:hypothetical protein
MHIEFRHLRTIKAIYENGGLAKAADQLHITQSALSHQIKGLEDQAGVELFVRRSKPMKLSAAGMRLLRLAERILPEIDAMQVEFSGLRDGKSGRLHIAIECHACFESELYQSSYPGIDVRQEVVEFLAHRISTNVRVLEGALTRLFAFASLVGREITVELTQDCLSDILRASDRKVTVEEIQRKVSDHYNIRLSDMLGPKRLRSFARPRQIAMYLCKQLTSRSLPEIGRRFGGRDHTTVMHGVRKIEDLRNKDSQMSDDLDLLRRSLEA